MDISVVVPLYNEDESIPELYKWIDRVMNDNKFTFELIFVNDGSTDQSWEIISKLSQEHDNVKGIKFRRNYGKSPALFCGFKEAQGDVVITMDADLQDSPDEIPGLYNMIVKEGYDLVRHCAAAGSGLGWVSHCVLVLLLGASCCGFQLAHPCFQSAGAWDDSCGACG